MCYFECNLTCCVVNLCKTSRFVKYRTTCTEMKLCVMTRYIKICTKLCDLYPLVSVTTGIGRL